MYILKKRMRRLVFVTLLMLLTQGAWAQNVVIVGEVCPGCGVYVKGRHLQPSDHKAGCWWLAQQQSSSDSSDESESTWGQEPYSESGAFENVEGKPLTNEEYYELLLRTHCDFCGGTSIKHNGDCIVGRTHRWWQDAMHSGQEWRARTMRDNIVSLILGTESGKAKLHEMRGVTPQAPSGSTHLKDYTPKPEQPASGDSQAMIPCPLARPAPQFSGINEQSIVHEKFQTLAGVEYDLERRSHTDGGPVILGRRYPDGTIQWSVVRQDRDGKYEVYALSASATAPDRKVLLRDVHFEAEGRFLVMEYEGGFKKYFTADGLDHIASGYNVGVAPMMAGGRCYILLKPDATSTNKQQILYAGPHGTLFGEDLEMYDDAIIERHGSWNRLLNWDWKALTIDNNKHFKDIRCFNSDKGPYYVIEVSDGQFVLVARGFRRVGDVYESFEEAQAAWRDQ